MTRRTDSAFIASSGVARWSLRVQRQACFVAAALWILAGAAGAQTPYTTIYLWEYVDPTDPSQGKQASDTGVYPIWWPRAGLGMRPGSADLTQAYLAAADAPGSNFRGTTLVDAYLRGARLVESSFVDVDLTGADLAGANLDFSVFYRADLTNVSLRDAVLSGSSFDETPLTGADLSGSTISGQPFTTGDFAGRYAQTRFWSIQLTAEQLYSTQSYLQRDLTWIEFVHEDMRGWDFSGQDLSFSTLAARLEGADLTDAIIEGTRFGIWASTRLSEQQLASTASYKQGNLAAVYLEGDLSGWDLSGQNLTWSRIFADNLNGLDLTGADLRSGRFLSRVTLDEVRAAAITDNAIFPDGRVDGLRVQGGGSMRVIDFNPYRDDHFLRGEDEAWRPGPTAILVGEELAIAPQGELRLEFADPVWESTITFEPGIPVTLAGTLNLSLTAASAARSLVGNTYQLFDWSGVAPTGEFDRVVSDHGAVWDLDRLYTTGEVTLLTAAPEPAGWLIAAGALWLFTVCAGSRVRGPGMCALKPASSL